MTINVLDTGLKNELDKANANTLSALLAKLRFGSMLRGLVVQKIKQAPAAQSYQLATLQALTLPDDAKALTVERATVRAGGVTGELTCDAYGTTPLTGHIAVAPNGDLVVLAADAITSLDVWYRPMQHDVVEYTLPVAAGVLTIPAAATTAGVLALLEAEVTAGTVTGKKIVLVPGAAPATTKANLSVDKTQVLFNNGTDAPTMARVKLAVALPDVDVMLSAASPTF